jgi:hypothetical protein
MGGKPAALRSCIHIEVPERLVPVTMIIRLGA